MERGDGPWVRSVRWRVDGGGFSESVEVTIGFVCGSKRSALMSGAIERVAKGIVCYMLWRLLGVFSSFPTDV